MNLDINNLDAWIILIGAACSILVLGFIIWLGCRQFHKHREKKILKTLIVEAHEVDLLKPMVQSIPDVPEEKISILPDTPLSPRPLSPRPMSPLLRPDYISTGSIGSQPTLLSVRSPARNLRHYPSSVFTQSSDSIVSLPSIKSDFSVFLSNPSSLSIQKLDQCAIISPKSSIVAQESIEMPPLVIPFPMVDTPNMEHSRVRCECFSPPNGLAPINIKEQKMAMAACPTCSAKLAMEPPARTTSNRYDSLSIRLAEAASLSRIQKEPDTSPKQAIESYSYIIDSKLQISDAK